jgi:hypothetical protein
MTESDSLAAALARVQSKLPAIKKSETATVRSDKGSYSCSYADLAAVSAAVMPLLGAEGLSFLARPTVIDGDFVLAYSLLHTSGDREDGVYPLPTGGTPQQIGSAISYCLCAVVGVAAEQDDDDGRAATERASRAPARRRTTRRKGSPTRSLTPCRQAHG